MSPALAVRGDSSEMSTTSSTLGGSHVIIYAIAISIGAAVVIAFAFCCIMRYRRRRAADRRGHQRGISNLSFATADKESEIYPHVAFRPFLAKGDLKTTSGPRTSEIVLPERAIVNDASGRSASNRYREIGPTPLSVDLSRGTRSKPRPLSLAIRVTAASPSPRSSSESQTGENTPVLSSFPSPPSKRFSALSAISSKLSPSSPRGPTRKVRQIFTPVLPDELVLRCVGESLTVIQTFDDGWYLVERAGFISPNYSYPKPPPVSQGQRGTVPAWCFMSPMEGLPMRRPERKSSLGLSGDNKGQFSP